MSKLAMQQQALLAALFDWPSDNATQKLAAYADLISARGLNVHKANGHALAQNALHAAYPVLAQLFGEQSFSALARAYWHAQPPLRGDVAQWGGALAAFVMTSAQLQDLPYLADMAALEWALHRCASAADASTDAASFALLANHELADLHLKLAPGCSTFSSAWPVCSLWAAHTDQSVSFSQVVQRLQDHVAESALVWRVGLRCQVRSISPDEHQLLSGLLSGKSFGSALNDLTDFSNLDISGWLPMAVQSGLLLGVTGPVNQDAGS